MIREPLLTGMQRGPECLHACQPAVVVEQRHRMAGREPQRGRVSKRRLVPLDHVPEPPLEPVPLPVHQIDGDPVDAIAPFVPLTEPAVADLGRRVEPGGKLPADMVENLTGREDGDVVVG